MALSVTYATFNGRVVYENRNGTQSNSASAYLSDSRPGRSPDGNGGGVKLCSCSSKGVG